MTARVPFRCVSLAVLALACGLGLPRGARAAEPGIDELEDLLAAPVYAASKYSQKAAQAPASVTVLTAGDIRTYGWRTLAEVLNAVRGVHVRADQAYDYLGVRGFSRPGDYSSRVLLLIDGVRANENFYDSALIGREFPLDIGLIERVEFIAGPGSALYGSNAVYGVVNVITRSAANLRGNELTLKGGSARDRKLSATLGRDIGSGTLLVGISGERRPGHAYHYPAHVGPDHPEGRVDGLDAEDDRKAYARYTSGEWVLSALASDRTKQVPNAPYDMVFADPAAVFRDRFASTDVTWQRDSGAGRSAYLHVGVGAYEYRDLGRYEPDGELQRYRDQGRWLGAEARWTRGLWEAHRFVYGVEYQRNFRQRTDMVAVEPANGVLLDTSATSDRLGLFVNDEIALRPDVTLGLGARFDKSTRRTGRLTPRGSLLWTPLDGLTLKMLSGSAFRDPNAYELQPGIPGSTLDPSLTRERLHANELAADWRASQQLRLAASLFQTRIRGLIEQVVDEPTGLLVYRNTGSARATGLELEAEYIGGLGQRVRSSWTQQQVRLSDGRVASNAPAALFKLHASTPVASSATRLGLELLGVSGRRTLSGARLRSELVTNLTAQHDPADKPWALFLSVYNVADVARQEPAGPEHLSDSLPREGRSAVLGMSVRF